MSSITMFKTNAGHWFNFETRQNVSNLLFDFEMDRSINRSLKIERNDMNLSYREDIAMPPTPTEYLLDPDYDNMGNLPWQDLFLVGLLCILIVITVIGNTLIILSVLTTRRLRTVTNCFVMSLAVADWLVGLFVMPPAVALHLVGSWQLGWVLCDIWISLDVLLCTASILSLCAISVDRYLAVTQPLNYSRRRRSKRLALFMILIVWLLALAITCPPILGWYEPGRREGHDCRYNRNKGYVVFSAMGSFFIPMAVMLYVYLKISCVVAARHDQLTEIHNEVQTKSTNFREEIECDNDTSEAETSSPRRKNFCSAVELRKQSKDSEPVLEYYEIRENCPCKSLTPTKTHTAAVHSYELVTAQSEFQKSKPLTRSSTICYKNQNVDLNSKQIWRPNSLTIKVNEQNTDTMKSNKINKSISNRLSSLRRETKTAQTLSIVVGGFIACWLPFFVYYLLTPFLPDSSVSPTFMSILTWLGWINSAINPFIYAFYSADFRIAFWRLTFRKLCKSSNRSALAMQHR